MLRKIFFTALVFVSHITYGADGNVEEWTTIKNGNMWIDSDGNEIQAHGAGFLKVNDTWLVRIGHNNGIPTSICILQKIL